VQPRFRTEHDGVAELCRRLDGLPLAIELAAARTKALPVEEIAARLDDRFGLLVARSRPGARHQGGLRAAIDWSYDLLFEEERRVFRSLAVFADGAAIDAVEAVCGPHTLDVVTRLVDKSLLMADATGPAARFRMLESLRDYGLDRLTDAGERDQVLAAHVTWCTSLAEEAERGIRGPDQLAWLDRLDLEHHNLRASLSHAAAADPDAGLRLIGALILPWWFRSRGREARRWLEACLATAGDAPTPVLAKALTWSGLLADFNTGTKEPPDLEHELDEADRRQQRAVAISLDAGDERAVAVARLQRSLTLTRRALAGIAVDPAEVATLVAASAEFFERHGDHFSAGSVRTIEAVGHLAAGDVERGARSATTALEHARKCGDRFVQGRVAWIEGLLADAAGDTAGAYRHIERGLVLLDELGMGQEVTVQAALLVDLAEQRGEQELAALWRTFVAGRSGGLARHDVLLMASARNGEGLQARHRGDFDQALAAHLEALAGYEEAGVTHAVAFTESCLGFLALEMGDPAAAGAHHAAALKAAVACGERDASALALEGLAAGLGNDRAEDAAVLLGAADRLRGESSNHGAAMHLRDVAAITERVRGLLDPVVFTEASGRGAAMGRDEAVQAASALAAPGSPT
jgi:hypothetical protein